MNHPDLEAQVDALLDGELAIPEANEIQAHLAGCAQCRQFLAERQALSGSIRGSLPRLTASEDLRRKVQEKLHEAQRPVRIRPAAWQWLAMAASLVIVAIGGWQVGRRQSASSDLADEVLRSHIRAMQPGHLTDVLSTDQHTVKPWFDGVLDYSPPAYDFSGKDFPLIGGRLDYLASRPVAALVYGRRKHFITLLVWPVERDIPVAPESRSQQGYHQLHWTTAEYSYWAVSDLGVAELSQFAGLVKQADSAAGKTLQ